MKLPIGIFQFVMALLPDLVKLYEKHGGNAVKARRDMVSLTSKIEADRAAVDAEIDRQREAEK